MKGSDITDKPLIQDGSVRFMMLKKLTTKASKMEKI